MAKTKKSESKAKSENENLEVPVAEEAASTTRVRVTKQDFIKQLTEKLTHFDAHLVLEAAMLSAGIPGDHDDGYFKKEETRDICLALIKRGGPAFSVGTRVYREVIGG